MAKADKESIYGKSAKKAGRAKAALIVLLVLIAAFSIIVYRKDITAENLRSLLRYVNVNTGNLKKSDEFSINIDGDFATEVYKNEIAVAGKSSVKLYTSTGKAALSDNEVTLSRPAVNSSEKYFSAYDIGGNRLYIYNYFSRIYEAKTPYPIYLVRMSDEGSFLYVTSAKGYKSAVSVFDVNFENCFNWYSSDKYIMSADIRQDGIIDIVVGTVMNNEQGDFVSFVILFDQTKEKEEFSNTYNSEMLLDVKFAENGNIFVLTDKTLRVLSDSGSELYSFAFDKNSMETYKAGKNVAFLALKKSYVGKEHRVLIIDSKGNTLKDDDLDMSITSADISSNTVFALGIDEVYTFNTRTKKENSIAREKSYKSIGAIDDYSAYTVFDDRVELFNFK